MRALLTRTPRPPAVIAVLDVPSEGPRVPSSVLASKSGEEPGRVPAYDGAPYRAAALLDV